MACDETNSAPPPVPAPAGYGRGYRLQIAAVFGLYLAFCGIYMAVIRPNFGPDENLHAATVRLLAEHGRMPLALGGMRGGSEGGHPFHPPLYYLSAAPFYYLTRSPGPTVSDLGVRAMRFASLLWGLAALWQFWLFLRELWPDRPSLHVGALGLVALLPHYLCLSSVVINDTIAAFFGILLLRKMAAVTLRPDSRRLAVEVGLAMAGFAWAKAQMVMLLPLYGVWLLALLWLGRLTWRQVLAYGLWGYGLLVVVGSGWYIRNCLIYGSIMPRTLEAWGPRALDGHLMGPLEVYTSGAIVDLLARSVVGLAMSLPSGVSWLLAPPPPGVNHVPVPAAVPYAALSVLLAAAVAGHLRACLARRGGQAGEGTPQGGDETASAARYGLWLAYGQFALLYAAITCMAVFVHVGWYQGGRYLYPAIWGVALFMVLGHAALCQRAERWLVWVSPAVLVAINILCVYNLVAILNPAYAGG
jgi:hypothetical protein